MAKAKKTVRKKAPVKKKPVKKTVAKKPLRSLDETKMFGMTKVAGTTIKLVLLREPGMDPIEEMEIVQVKMKRVGSAIQKKTPGGAKLMTIDVLYKDAT